MINFNRGDSTYLQEDRNRQKHDDSMLAHKCFFGLNMANTDCTQSVK